MCQFCRYIYRINMPESLFFIFFLQRLLGFGVLRVVQKVLRIGLVQYVCEEFVVQVSSQLSWRGIVRRIQAEPDSTSYRCFESLLVGDAGKIPTWQHRRSQGMHWMARATPKRRKKLGAKFTGESCKCTPRHSVHPQTKQ